MDVHAGIRRLADLFVAGRLTEEADQEVAAHAEECGDCGAELEEAEARARRPHPSGSSFLRVGKMVLATSFLVGLVLLGGIFQNRGLAASPVEEKPSEEAVFVSSKRTVHARDMEPNRKALDLEMEEVEGHGGGYGTRNFRSMAGGVAAEAPAEPFLADAKLIRQAELQIEADSFTTAQARVGAIVAEEKGFLSGADTTKLPNGKMSGTLTVRIPPERFDAVLERFRELGVVRHQKLQTRDVTKTYVDLEARLGSKQVLMERLKTVLVEAKGTVKELMEVEVQIGKTIEEIESIKGELKYYDGALGHATIVLRLSERDLGQPAELVETLEAALGLSVPEAEPAYVQAQKILADAGGQITEAQMTREGGGVQGLVRGRVEAGKFPEVRQALRALGHVVKDTAKRRRAAQGATALPGGIPVRAELAAVEIQLSTHAAQVTRTTRLVLEAQDVDAAYQSARRAFEEAGASVTGGGLNAASGGSSASLGGELDVDRAAALQAKLAQLGKSKEAETRHSLPAAGAAPLRERARLDLTIATPEPLVAEEKGLTRMVRATFSGSVAGILWSIERLVVGISLAAPWVALGLLAWFLYRRRRKAVEAEASA